MEFRGANIAKAWEKSVSALLKDGEWVPSERGQRTLEIRNVVLSIRTPMAEPRIPDKYSFSKDFVKNHSSILKPYWDSVRARLYKFGQSSIDQVGVAVASLEKDWYTRRTYLSLWDPSEDIISSHPPGPVGLQLLIRDDKLHLTSVLRSEDAWMQAVPDIMALSNIQAEVAERMNIGIGTYTQLSVSYHIYETDLVSALEIFGEKR